MKIAVILGDTNKNMLAKLSSMFTKCPAYHIGFLDETTGFFYDMYWIRRKRKWPRYESQTVLLFDEPNVTADYLEHKLVSDDSEYGFMDYLSFMFRSWLPVKNHHGMICSEMVNHDIKMNGGDTPFSLDGAPPSPCDILAWLHKTHKSAG